VSEYFVLLTGCTSFHIIGYPLVHFWPGVRLFGFSNCFIMSGVSSSGVIVGMHHDQSQKLVWGLFDCHYCIALCW
jgi:hypothetical protein